MSVFEKHGEEIATYEKAGGTARGRLLFAMAILSDCQEMAGGNLIDVVNGELDEVKELLASVIKLDNDIFTNLWACREMVADGLAEYGCEFFVRASSMAEAETEAWEYVKRNWIYDNPDEERPYTDFFQEEEQWMQSDTDYRGFKAEVCQQITSLTELIQFLHIPN